MSPSRRRTSSVFLPICLNPARTNPIRSKETLRSADRQYSCIAFCAALALAGAIPARLSAQGQEAQIAPLDLNPPVAIAFDAEELEPDGAAELVQHVQQLPPDVPVARHVAKAGRVSAESRGSFRAAGEPVAAGPASPVADRAVGSEGNDTILVYSNDLSRLVLYPPSSHPTAMLADDITTTATAGCLLDRYVARVTGDHDSDGETLGDFSVTVGLYDVCPGAGGMLIPGTECAFSSLPGIGVQELTCAMPKDVEIPLPSSFYFGVSFSREDAGVLIGSPPTLGISADRFDFPVFPCSAGLGGYPFGPHASFYFQAYVRTPCDRAFPGYLATNQGGAHFSPGTNVYFADDLHLAVPDCSLVAYEIGIKGTGLVLTDLRTELINHDPSNAGLLPGTRFIAQHAGNAATVVRHEIDPPILLPSQDLWIVFRTNTHDVGPIATKKMASVGRTEDRYWRYDDVQWLPRDSSSDSRNWTAFEVTLYCEGLPPVGACCDMIRTDDEDRSVCRQIAEMNCLISPSSSGLTSYATRWIESVACEPDPFVPACGLSACCTPDDTCANLTKQDCEALIEPGQGIIWQRGLFCGVDSQACPLFHCIQRTGICDRAHDSPGCRDPFCCYDVCTIDSWCCRVEWDRQCVEEYESQCTTRPTNDVCVIPSSYGSGTMTVAANSSTFLSTKRATIAETDPEFSCLSYAGQREVDGTVWFKFYATHTSARIQTCNTDRPDSDSVLQVFRLSDPSVPEEEECDHLEAIACADDVFGCGSGRNAALCVDDLIPGEPYYIVLASATSDAKGIYQLDVQSPCPYQCPGGVIFIDPPTGVVDARDPYFFDYSQQVGYKIRGIDQLLVQAPPGAEERRCWSLCETARPPEFPESINDIAQIDRLDDGHLLLTLNRAITPFAATAVSYMANNGVYTVGRFSSYPGNVAAHASTSFLSLLALIDAINGTYPAPWGEYSTDCDFSGQTRPQDILCVIDLLNRGPSWPTIREDCD